MASPRRRRERDRAEHGGDLLRHDRAQPVDAVRRDVAALYMVPLFYLTAIGLGSGASLLIGQAWGAKEPDRVRAIAGTTLMTGLAPGLAVAVFGGGFAEAVLTALGRTARHLRRKRHALAPDAAFQSHLRIDRALPAKVLASVCPPACRCWPSAASRCRWPGCSAGVAT